MNIQLNETKNANLENISIVGKKLTNRKLYYNIIKRITDIIVSILGIIILIPMILIIYIIKKIMKDQGSIFYTQERIGKNGKKFKIYKFRTMVTEADEILKKYLEENQQYKEEYEKKQKIRNDPRITKLGKFLRKTSLDEFPQFINVLKSEMSLIGPRPIVESEICKFGNKLSLVYSIKPGITGYWTTNGRSSTTYEERIKLETFYVQNYSLKMDIQIFIKTIKIVIKKEGAI